MQRRKHVETPHIPVLSDEVLESFKDGGEG